MSSQVRSLQDAVQAGLVEIGATTELEPGALFSLDPGVAAPTRIGEHSRIMHGAIVYAGAEIAGDCLIGHYAVIGAGAKIGSGTRIDQGCVIGAGVRLGERNQILPHSTIINQVEIANANVIGPFISIGTQPQHTHVPVSSGKIHIGSHNVLREFMTIHLPTRELTSIGSHCFMMAYNHIPHDAVIGDYVTLANSCQIGGHTYIHHHANLGLSCVVHQFSVIGAGAMVAMGSIIIKDIPPYVTFISGAATKLNRVGLERLGKTPSDIESLQALYAAANLETLDKAFRRSPGAWWYHDLAEFFRVQQRKTCDYRSVGSDIDASASAGNKIGARI